MELAVTILVIAALLALNALFVAAEFAIVGAARSAIKQLSAEGSARAALVARVLAEPRRQDRYIATAQLGITIASLGLGMYGERQVAAWLQGSFAGTWLGAALPAHVLASAVAVAFLTYLHIVLGEMVPKAVALVRPERAAMWIAPIMEAIQKAAFPLVVALNGIANTFLRRIGVERRVGVSEELYTADELHHIVEDSRRGGLLGREEANVFSRLLEFNELTAREVMVPRVRIRGIEIRSGRYRLREVLGEDPHTRYPVYAHDLDHIVGMVHVRTLARALSEGRRLRQSDLKRLPFVPGSATLDTVLSAMRRGRSQMAVVMDEHGGTDGLVTTEDLLEEVVGEIEDEGAAAHPPITGDPRGTLRVAGTARIDELGDYLGLELAHEEVDTVSGLVLDLLDRPPQVGDRVRWAGFEIEVAAVTGYGVAACRVTPPPASEPPAPR